KMVDAATDFLHSPSYLASENQRRFQSEDVSQSVADFSIDWIFRCCPPFYQQLIISRRGAFHLPGVPHLFVSLTPDAHCFHDVSSLVSVQSALLNTIPVSPMVKRQLHGVTHE